ncbi:DMT family transporter [Desulfosporosinus sp. PR]|uniref:DMT family transporter n=1 Tax=Candidatus Desulfosporosinus nitrosoreducens TaxID=3401928 RepID=UPI0027F6CD19|nr:DMT family transporter [Desulfosporosinus sp. PR]MDQ7095700.1 DMT family transporter [Desulfosporosinus sp. PR]
MPILKCKTHLRGILFASAGGIGWGLSGVCGQYLFMTYHLNSAWLTAVRMVFAGFILTGMSFPRQKQNMIGILKEPKDTLQLIAFSIAGLLLCQYAYLSAIQYSNSGTATVLQSLNVVIMAVFLTFKGRVLPEKVQILSTVLALAGVGLIATNGNLHSMVLSSQGLFWGIMSALGVVVYTLLSQRIVEKWGNQVVTGLGMLIGGSLFFAVTRAWEIPVSLDAEALAVLAVIILLGTAAAFTFYLQGVRDIGPVKATLIVCLEPVVATVVSALWLHTRFNTIDILGFCCILATVFLSVKSR